MGTMGSFDSSSNSFAFFFFSVLSCSLFPFFSTASTMMPGQSITGDQTIVSSGNNFVLGFFSPGNSTNHYIGIWYKKVSPLLYVWVANKDNPLPPSSTGVLRFGVDGNLNLVDETTGKIYWSTNTTHGSQANTSIATLLDSGNLIITREDRKTEKTHVWQSFDYPSDVFLPGMKIGLNRKTGESWILKSWVDINNPSFGGFDLGIDGESMNQLMIMERGVKHWRSGPWNGERFDGVLEMSANKNVYNYSLVSEGDEIYFTYSIYDPSVISMVMLDVTGKMQQLTWVEESRNWVLLWAHPGDDCEVYGVCGAFGICRSGPSCDCFQGFQPQSPEKWFSGDWSGGCSRKRELACGQVGNNKFLRVSGVRLPDGYREVVGSNLGECESACIRSCTCNGFAVGGGGRCLVWDGSLMDVGEAGVGGHDLYVRVDASELDGTKKWALAIIIVGASLGMFLLLSRTVFIWWRDEKERGLGKKGKDQSLFDMGITMANSNDSINKLGDGNENGLELPLFDFASIATATDDFSLANKLGEGGFGPVYKGKLPDGQEIAVKRLSRRSGQGLGEFKNEVLLLSKLQHRNLVRVLGFCTQGEEKILIYEYMPNKSLDSFLFDPNKRTILDWAKSFHIVEGIAQGLLYLHQYSRLRIIHRDLKASNILLDGEMNPKISDFGMARIFGGNQTQANTNRVVGTYGYMAPEYALDGLFSVKSDVFSFGVLLLEIISGQRNNGYHFEHSLNLMGHAWQLWKGGRSLELLDPSLGDSFPTQEVLRCIHIGLLCVQEDAEDRPTVSSIVLMLSSEDAALPEPKRPAFSLGENPAVTDSSSGRPRSINEVTISVIEGR